MMTAATRLIRHFLMETITGSMADARTIEVKTTRTTSLTAKRSQTQRTITTALKIVPELMVIWRSRSCISAITYMLSRIERLVKLESYSLSLPADRKKFNLF